jgi:3-hydroxyisobutyrate dehydrogenase-like beta-hydroxyacid dehydrogenase
MKETVAVLGTGKMGTALVRAFAAAAARDTSLLVASLTNYGVCGQVLFTAEMGESLRGKTVVQLTSGTPSNARTGAAWAAQHGVHYLDGAILAYPSWIATEYATVFYAGDRTVFEAHKPTLQALAHNTVFVAEAIGSAAALDCAILEACYGGCLAFLHAAAMCESEGISSSRFFEYKRVFISALDVSADDAKSMLERHDYTGDQCSLDTHVGALSHIVSLSHEAGLDNRLPDTLYAVYAAAVAAGLGAKELPAVYELFRAKRT